MCLYKLGLNIGSKSVYTRFYLNSLQAADVSLSSWFFLTWHNLSRQDSELLTAAAVEVWKKILCYSEE